MFRKFFGAVRAIFGLCESFLAHLDVSGDACELKAWLTLLAHASAWTVLLLCDQR